MSTLGFLVKFIGVGRDRVDWEERIERPVNELKIIAAVRRKKAHTGKALTAPYVDDYGGFMYSNGKEFGRYIIVPGSERK